MENTSIRLNNILLEVRDQSRCVSVWISLNAVTTLGYHKGSSFVRCTTSVTIIVLKGIKSPLVHQNTTVWLLEKINIISLVQTDNAKMKSSTCTARMFSGCNNKCERILMHQRRSRGNVSKTQEFCIIILYDWFPVTSFV